MKWLLLAISAGLGAVAQAAAQDAELGIGIDGDNLEGRGSHLDVALTMAGRHKLSFATQNARSSYAYWSPCTGQYLVALIAANASDHPLRDAVAAFPELTIDTRSRDSSWSYSYLGEVWGGGGRGARYDGGDGFRTQETSLNGYWQGDHWDVGSEIGRRETDFALETQRLGGTLQNPQCVSRYYRDHFNSRSAGLTVGYTFDNGWRFYANGVRYDSDFDLPANVSYETLLLRSVNAGGLSTALTQHRRRVGVQIPFEAWWLSVESGREQSWIEESTTHFYSVWLVWAVSERWELELSVSNTRLDLGDEAQSEDAEQLRSIGLGTRWYW